MSATLEAGDTFRVGSDPPLSERERKSLDAGIKEFDLEGGVSDRSLLPDQLIHPRLSNLACTIGRGIGSMITAGFGAIHVDSEANRRPPLRRAQDHMEVARMKPEYNLSRRRFEGGVLCADIPRSAESPLI